MSGAHIGDDAELYALGALDPVERVVVETHVAECAACATRVAEAESVAATLAAALPAYEPPPRLQARILAGTGFLTRVAHSSPWLAMAAAAAVLIGLFGWQNAALQAERGRTTVALSTIVHSHFLHASMSKAAPSVPAAKVLYARDGSWLYVVADRAVTGLHVILRRGAAERDAGELQPAGGVSTLFVPDAGRPDSVFLRNAGGVTDGATLVY